MNVMTCMCMILVVLCSKSLPEFECNRGKKCLHARVLLQRIAKCTKKCIQQKNSMGNLIRLLCLGKHFNTRNLAGMWNFFVKNRFFFQLVRVFNQNSLNFPLK